MKMETTERPWGNFCQFTLNEKCTVKVMTVKPNQRLSLQYHNGRDEKWYFLTDATMQLGKKMFDVKAGEEIRIDRKTPHRLMSKGGEVKVLEISLGTFDEDDLVRMEDDYGRIEKKD